MEIRTAWRSGVQAKELRHFGQVTSRGIEL